HVTAVALDRITDRKVAPLSHRVVGVSYHRQMNAVAPYLLTRRDRYRIRPAEGHACVRAVDEVGTVFLQTDGDRVEGERLVAEDIRKADANLVAPEIRLDDRTQSLCGCAAVAPVGEREGEVGLDVRRRKSCRRGRKRLVLHDRRGVDEKGGWRGGPARDPRASRARSRLRPG